MSRFCLPVAAFACQGTKAASFHLLICKSCSLSDWITREYLTCNSAFRSRNSFRKSYIVIHLNLSEFMNCYLSIATILRRASKNIVNKTKSGQDIRRYRNQGNLVVKLNRKSRGNYLKSNQSKSIENDKQFLETVKPLFLDKTP